MRDWKCNLFTITILCLTVWCRYYSMTIVLWICHQSICRLSVCLGWRLWGCRSTPRQGFIDTSLRIILTEQTAFTTGNVRMTSISYNSLHVEFICTNSCLPSHKAVFFVTRPNYNSCPAGFNGYINFLRKESSEV